MIPTVDMDVDPAFPADLTMGLPDEEDVAEDEGYGCFRDVWTIGEVSRDEAVRMIEEERRLITLVDQASRTHAEFEAMAQAVEAAELDYLPAGYVAQHPNSELVRVVGDNAEDGSPLDALELGVAGLSYALASVGCFTAASCRSHCSDDSWSDRPVIFFAAERSTAEWLTPLVRQSGCGYADGSKRGDRLLTVEAPSITNFMDLANRIVQQADQQDPVKLSTDV
ncbi:hypothetical protein CP966_24730 [Streptomyces galilaeus]|uniref:hypothetical protein n=1 Tax=Streptomyces galilaeus TaxID=33899 RepID=UPI00123D3D4B|nr:hypothetical protein [Streptomyces galilaeus]QEU68089.1 hypothetical protein CP966_24730 [Streptomyces galilaeus]GGW68498.1 hypothetical protein GCM10010350_61380 [Streptomyces galilaeus]